MTGELRVRLMGGLAVDGIAERDLGSRKARTLLQLLAVARGATVTVDRAADALWGERLPAKPADQVGVLVSRLRGVLGTDRVVRRSGGYALVGAWIDVDEIDRLVDEAANAHTAGRLAVARAAADAALALVHGPLLPAEDGDWATAARQRVDAQVAAARRIKIEATFAAGDWPSVVAQAETVLADHPYDETVLRMLMRAHAASGSTAAALAAYGRARSRFAEDLGVAPSPETEQLHTELLLAGDVADRPVAVHRGEGVTAPGREGELRRLDELLSGARVGRSTIVAVEGEAGIGKSTLLAAWLCGVDRTSVFVVAGRCDELGRDLPLAPVADAVATAARMAGPAALHALAADETWLLATALGIGPVPTDRVLPGGDRHEAPDGEYGQQGQLFAAVLHALEVLAGDRTIVLVIEDLHDVAHASTLAWMAWAVHRAPRLLIVVTRRSSGPGVRGEVTISLGPLDVAAVGRLVGDDTRAADLHRRSGGHPLLLQAMLSTTDGGDVPASIREVVDRELGVLHGAAASVRTAAVIGPDIDVDVVAWVQRVPAIGVLADLEAAAVGGLLVESEAGYRFRHELVRAAVLGSVPVARQSLVHREAAQALAARHRRDPLAIAYHARHGGDSELAASALVDAAQLAADRYDVARAEELLTEAYGIEPDPATLVARARIRMARLDLDGADADAAAAISAGAGVPALMMAGWIAYYRRDHALARTLAEEAIAGATDDAARAACLVLSARVLHGAGELPAALDRFEEAEGGPAETRELGAIWHGNALLHAGRPAEALALVEHALRGPPGPHPFAPLHGRWSQTLALAYLGRIGEAFDALDGLGRMIERSGVLGARFLGPALNIRGYLLRSVDRLDEADAANESSLVHTSDGSGAPAAESMHEAYWVSHLDLADGRLVAGDLDGAAELIERMNPMARWTVTMAWHQRHRLDLLRARLALAAGDRERAVELATAVAADARRRTSARYAALADAVVAIGGGTRDVGAVATTVDQLGQSAALEAWWLTAELGRRFAVDAWVALAGRRAGDLVRAAGPFGETLSRRVSAILD